MYSLLVALCKHIGVNVYCHLIDRDDENILSSYTDQSDDTINLLRYMHTNQQRSGCIRHSNPITLCFKNEFTMKTVNVDQS